MFNRIYRSRYALGVVACFLSACTITASTLQSSPLTSPSVPPPAVPVQIVTSTLSLRVFLPILQQPDQNFYVATTGNDDNTGTFNAPWRTLQKAADAASPGKTVFIRAGTYTGFNLTRSGLSFVAYPGEEVLVEPATNARTIKITNVTNVTIRRLIVENNSLPYGTGIHVEDAAQITIADNVLRRNQGFGVVFKNVSDSSVENNDVTGNGNGIEIRYGSSGVVLRNNRIYQNDRPVDSGRGGIGVTFYRTTGPVTAVDNQLWSNYVIGNTAPDGVGFEVYAASNVTMTRNVLWDNQTVLETGTDDGKTPCDRITYTRNIAYRVNWQQGLILRCASNSLVAHNIFAGLDTFVYDLSHFKGKYGASIENLRILNNIAINGRVYSIDNAIPASVMIDNNLSYNWGPSVAYVYDQGNTGKLSTFQSWTGYDLHGLNADPWFVNPANHDYHLTAGSPAIDAGLDLGEPYTGTAPDLGRYEYR